MHTFRAVCRFSQPRLLLKTSSTRLEHTLLNCPAKGYRHVCLRKSCATTTGAENDFKLGCSLLGDPRIPTADIDGACLVSRAAAAGLPAAMACLGEWRLFGSHGEDCNVTAAAPLLESAARMGDANAQFWLGRLQSDVTAFIDAGGDNSPSLHDHVVPPVPDAAAAAEVVSFIRATRKIAKANKIRRVKGLPPVPLPSSLSEGGMRVGNESCDSGAALRTNITAGKGWLLRAAAQEHAGAQVLLGNLAMQQAAAASEEAALSLYREGLRWYELAAQVAGVVTATPATTPDADATPAALHEEDAPMSLNDVRGIAHPAGSSSDSSSVTPPHPDALFNLGLWYYSGIPCVLPADPARAAAFLAAAAALGDPPSQLWLGQAMLRSQGEEEVGGVARDPAAGLGLIERAAGAGHPAALLHLARLHREGEISLGLLPDPRKTRYFLEAASDAGDADAAVELADAHYHGTDGCPVDLQRARSLFDAAAAAGHADAMVSAGAMALRGEGCAAGEAGPDYARAFALYSRAAATGHVRAWENLAALHATGSAGDGGVAVPRNLAAARYIHGHILPPLLLQQQQQQQQQHEAVADTLPSTVSHGDRLGSAIEDSMGGVIDLKHL